MHDPGTPAYEAARARVVRFLREIGEGEPRSGYNEMADDLEAGELMQLPAWITLQLIAEAANP